MKSIVIDTEFQSLLPTLDDETFKLLEENILENGCRDPLVLWGNTLIDGHNRYAICSKHGIQFKTVSKEFASREDVLIWIISAQVSRRNLSPAQMSYFRGRHYRAERTRRGTYTRTTAETHIPQNGEYAKPASTVAKLSQQYKVSKNTIGRDSNASYGIDALGEVSPELKRMILAGEVKMEKRLLGTIAAMQKEDIESLALTIEKGMYEKTKPAPRPNAEPLLPLESILAGMTPLDTAIVGVSDCFSALHEVTKKADRTKIKTALRTRIDTLEGLYVRV